MTNLIREAAELIRLAAKLIGKVTILIKNTTDLIRKPSDQPNISLDDIASTTEFVTFKPVFIGILVKLQRKPALINYSFLTHDNKGDQELTLAVI